jgi:crotonobetainyl-CoA:carnitine CoA-transferase CaiB-like acyl-CoA transferase
MGAFAAADGVQNIAISGQPMWEKFCQIVGRGDWIADPDFATEKLRVTNRPRLNRELQALFATNTVAHWVTLLNDAGVPCGPIYTIPAMFDDPQVRHLAMARAVDGAAGRTMRLLAQPVTLARTPPAIRRAAPAVGEHTDEVLREAGYDDASISSLRAKGVV